MLEQNKTCHVVDAETKQKPCCCRSKTKSMLLMQEQKKSISLMPEQNKSHVVMLDQPQYWLLVDNPEVGNSEYIH